jgi:4'-phosphopantetheinyl transferase EntD
VAIGVIEELLPDTVVAVEARGEPLEVALFPEEEAGLGQAVEKRRREFTTARACARQALERLGLPAQPIAVGAHGEPRWPAGIVGSITHCAGYCACVLARGDDLVTLGVDAEPNEPLPPGLLGDIARPEELGRLRGLGSALPEIHWDRLLFSAKEAVYKAWFPLAERWLGFEDAIVQLDPAGGTFRARLLVPGPLVNGGELTGFSGSWMVRDGLVVTAISLKPQQTAASD